MGKQNKELIKYIEKDIKDTFSDNFKDVDHFDEICDSALSEDEHELLFEAGYISALENIKRKIK